MLINYVSDKAMLFTGEPGVSGRARMMPLGEGLNEFLKNLNVTFRKDPQTKRPRANKLDSVKDREQKQQGKYYL